MEISPCLIGFTLLFSSIYMSIMKKDSKIFSNFMKLLNQSQKKMYSKIIYERMSIYVMGMILGLVLGIYYYFKYKTDKYRLCKFLCIIYIVKLGFYYLYPKSPLILYSLTNQKQVSAWADIYSEMKKRWILSLLVGFFGYLVLSRAF